MKIEKNIKIKHNNYMIRWKNKKIIGFIILLVFSSFTFTIKPVMAAPQSNPAQSSPMPTIKSSTLSIICANTSSAVCFIMKTIAMGADSLYSLLDGMLDINTDLFSQKSGNNNSEVFNAWKKIRNLSNAILVVVLLIIIISYITGYGLNQYNIKKMLPKIIIAALLANISFYVVQITVDISNILGYSIVKLLTGRINPFTFYNIGSKILILMFGGGAAKFTQTRFTSISLRTVGLSLLITVIAIVFISVIILLVREAVLLLILVSAPLAFMCMILPNTESIYKKWQKTLTACLMIFPIMSLLFGSAALASNIFIESDGILMKLLGTVIKVLPLIAAPGILQSAMASLPVVGQSLGKMTGFMKKTSNNIAKNNKFAKSWNNSALNRQSKLKMDHYQKTKNGGGFWNSVKGGSNQTFGTDFNIGMGNADAAGYNSLNQAEINDIDSLSGKINLGEAMNFANDLSSLTPEQIKENIKDNKYGTEVLQSFNENNGDFTKIAASSGKTLSKAGMLTVDQTNAIGRTLSKSNMTNENLTRYMTNIQNNAKDAGRIDVAGHIRGLGKDNNYDYSKATFDTSKTQEYIKNEIMRSDASTIANIKENAYDDPNMSIAMEEAAKDPSVQRLIKQAYESGMSTSKLNKLNEHSKVPLP